MATTKIVNQSILYPTTKNVDISTKIEFLLCLSLRDIVSTAVRWCQFLSPRWRTKSFPFKWKHWFFVSERSDLSKNVYIYNSPKCERKYLATLTILINVAVINQLMRPVIVSLMTMISCLQDVSCAPNIELSEQLWHAGLKNEKISITIYVTWPLPTKNGINERQ